MSVADCLPCLSACQWVNKTNQTKLQKNKNLTRTSTVLARRRLKYRNKKHSRPAKKCAVLVTMAALNVAEWSPEQVADWLTGERAEAAVSHGGEGVCRVTVCVWCRAGRAGAAVCGGAAGAAAGWAAAAHAALRRPGVPRHRRHRTPGTAARGCRTSPELCECDLHCIGYYFTVLAKTVCMKFNFIA